MKKHNYNNFINIFVKTICIISLFLMISSCRKTVDNIKLPEAPVKLVVCSYISPTDTIIRVNVSTSFPIFNSTTTTSSSDVENMIKNAKVEMWNDYGNTVNLQYYDTTWLFEIPASAFPIIAGNTYHLRVTSGDKIAEASCTVPFPNNSLKIISADTSFDQQSYPFNIHVSFKDTPGQTDYYRIYAYPQYMDSLSWPSSLVDDLISDKLKDEQLYSYTISNDDHDFRNNFSNGKPLYIKILLLHIDKNYYDFFKSTNNNSTSEGNPFAEPSLMYSNIEGGYGVFAAYNTYSIKINF